ncbi:MAG: hypothetical protein AAGJ18_09970 [Bacteroidota bacterium]
MRQLTTKQPSILLLLLAICLLIINCEKATDENLIIETLHIDATLLPYFERFVAEGASRGVTVDLDEKRIEGFLINIEVADVAGQCTYNSTSTRRINIDIDYWNASTDLEKEFVVFHELGHCYLERSHSDIQENRTCTSIMHSGTSGCRFQYTTFSRSAYLDELFEK